MKYRFEIIYQSQYAKQAAYFLENCDLAIGEFGITEIMTFSSANDLNIYELKYIINSAYESAGLTTLSIEGGKVE